MIMGGASSMERGGIRLSIAASVDSRTSNVRVCNADREVAYTPNTPENDTPAE